MKWGRDSQRYQGCRGLYHNLFLNTLPSLPDFWKWIKKVLRKKKFVKLILSLKWEIGMQKDNFWDIRSVTFITYLHTCTRGQSITQGSTMEISAHKRCIICFVVLIELGTLNNLWFWYRFWKTGMNFVLFWHFRKNMLLPQTLQDFQCGRWNKSKLFNKNIFTHR